MSARLQSLRARALVVCALSWAPPAALDAIAQAVYAPPAAFAPAPVALLGRAELVQLVAPIALYPDDLLAIVLPATQQPPQLVQAARFREAAQAEPSLAPPAAWDDAVVALLNYPDVLALLDRDLDWTTRLGQAMAVQQADVLAAVADFRNQVARAGNLRNDGRQVIGYDGGALTISPANPRVIYVPVYEPARVLVYQHTIAYGYYPQPYPLYYDPYPRYYGSRFWGLRSAFGIGWGTQALFVRHHHEHHHPFYGHRYDDRRYYRHHRNHDGHADRGGGGRGEWQGNDGFRRDWRDGHQDDHHVGRDDHRQNHGGRGEHRGTHDARQPGQVIGAPAQGRPPAVITGNGFVRDSRRAVLTHPAPNQGQTTPFGFVRDGRNAAAAQREQPQAQPRQPARARNLPPAAQAQAAQRQALLPQLGFGRNAQALAAEQRDAAARMAPAPARAAPQAAMRPPRAAMRAAHGPERQASQPARMDRPAPRHDGGFSRNAGRNNQPITHNGVPGIGRSAWRER